MGRMAPTTPRQNAIFLHLQTLGTYAPPVVCTSKKTLTRELRNPHMGDLSAHAPLTNYSRTRQ
jgi:hypothetical protein